jgi:MoxR-vWA-beta-propeller ternary system domain bpX4
MEDVFVRSLLREGRLRIGADAAWQLTDAALDEAKSALAAQSLTLAGPPIVGSLDALLPALHVVYRFGRRALHPETTSAEADASLKMPQPPRSAAEHLGADLALRFLPGLLQRLVARDPGDELALAAKRVLCEWPLSGVLADLREPPTSPLDFGGHLGIRFLYAERLAERERPGWYPPAEASDGLEMVRQTLGRPTAPRTEEATTT